MLRRAKRLCQAVAQPTPWSRQAQPRCHHLVDMGRGWRHTRARPPFSRPGSKTPPRRQALPNHRPARDDAIPRNQDDA